MNFYLETSANPLVFNPNSFFLNPFFKFSLQNCFLKVGNKTRVLKIWLTLIKGNGSETVNFTINVGNHYFKDSSVSIINQNIVLQDLSDIDLPITIIKEVDAVKVNIKYSYLMNEGFDPLIICKTQLDNEPISDEFQLLSDIDDVMSFDFLIPQLVKIRLTSSNLQKNVIEIVNGVASRSNILSLINLDHDTISFETKPYVNPYGLTSYTFEFVDQNNNLINIDKFSGILKLERI